MSKDNVLFELVKRLDKGEKKNLKLYSSLRGGDKNYLKLYSAFQKMKVYDEEKLKLDLKNEPFVKTLSNEKLRLYKVLMKSLRQYHEKSSTTTKINHLLHESEILYNKGFLNQCKKTLKKALEIAKTHEHHLAIIEIMQWNRKISFSELSVNGLSEDLENIKEEENRIGLLNNETKYWSLHAKLFKLLLEKGLSIRSKEEEEHFDKLLKELNSKNNPPKTFNAKVTYHQALSSFYRATENVIQTYENHKKHILLFQNHPEQIAEKPKKYIAVLNNFITAASHLNKKEEFHSTKKTLLNLITNLSYNISANYANDVVMHIFTQELHMNIVSGNFKDGANVARPIITSSDDWLQIPNKVRQIILLFNLSYVHFGAEDFSTALKFTNRILNEYKASDFEYLYYFTKILNLLIHYELNNYDLLEYEVMSTYRYMKKRKHSFQFENLFIDFIRKKLPNINSEKKLISELENLKLKLEKIANDPFENRALNAFDLISWLDSKVKGKTFSEVKYAKVK